MIGFENKKRKMSEDMDVGVINNLKSTKEYYKASKICNGKVVWGCCWKNILGIGNCYKHSKIIN